MRLPAATLALAIVTYGQARRFPAPPTEVKPEERSSVNGQVVSAVTGEPVRKAIVMLNHRGGAGALSVRSDSGGRFAVEQLMPGEYALTVEAPGFVSTNRLRQKELQLPPASRKTGLVIKLQPQGVISGRVLDEEGDPQMFAQVFAVAAKDKAGRGAFVNGSGGLTNDLGEFRLSGLAPGSYYVVVQNMRGTLAGVQSPSSVPAQQRTIPVPTYHPSAVDASAATVLRITPGADLRGVDVRMRSARAVRVSGRVNHEFTSAQLAATHVMLSRAHSPLFAGGPGASPLKAGGAFEFRAVTSVDYVLWTHIPAGDPEEPPRHFSARLPLHVGNADIDELLLQPLAPIDVVGVVKLEGREEFDPGELIVTLQARDAFPGPPMPGGQGKVNSDGRFVMLGTAPGSYRVNLHGASPGHYLKAALLGGKDVLKGGVDLAASGELAIALASDGGTIEGQVTLPETNAPDRVLVAAWPAGDERVQLHRIRFAELPPGGRFQLRGIAPGSYKLIAAEDTGGAEPLDFNDPELLKQIEDRAESVDVEANGRITRTLKPVRAGEGE